MNAVCKICNVRRAKRHCPGVSGDICTVCCGTEREVTVRCPLSCVYLQESRKHAPLQNLNPAEFPHPEIRVSEEFLRSREPLLVLLGAQLGVTALDRDEAYDSDVRQALDALAQTYKTLESGLVLDSRPENPIAARLYRAVQERVADIQSRLQEHGGVPGKDILVILVFLQRMHMQHDNHRPRGRAFIDFLRTVFPREALNLTSDEGREGLIVTP